MSDATAKPGNKKNSHDEKLASVEKKWAEFLELFADNETCLNSIFDTVGVSLYICPRCKSLDVEKYNGARTIKCRKCKEVDWVTAGTLFHRIRLPLVWFGSLWLLANGVSFNANQLHKIAGVAYSTAWKIHKKLTMAIAAFAADDAHSVPSALFSEVIIRRSRETPAHGHPRDEEIEIAKADQSTDYEVPEGLSASQTQVFEALSDTPRHFDELCQRTNTAAGEMSAALIMLELMGLARRLPGDNYTRQRSRTSDVNASEKSSPKTAVLIKASIAYIQETFHGVSRRYLQLFLAAHWCWADRRRWTLGALLQHCLEVGEISLNEIRAYVSPQMVQLADIPIAQAN